MDSTTTTETTAPDQTQTEPNTQSSAYWEIPNPSLEDRINHCFTEAKRYNSEADEETRLSDTYANLSLSHNKSSLLKARLVGEYLNRAKELVKQKGDKWLPVLREKFGNERNGQNYMEIARRWAEIEPQLAKHPTWSIEHALQLLRNPHRPQPCEEQIRRSEVSSAFRKILDEVEPPWSPKDLIILHRHIHPLGPQEWGDAIKEGMTVVMEQVLRKIAGFRPVPTLAEQAAANTLYYLSDEEIALLKEKQANGKQLTRYEEHALDGGGSFFHPDTEWLSRRDILDRMSVPSDDADEDYS